MARIAGWDPRLLRRGGRCRARAVRNKERTDRFARPAPYCDMVPFGLYIALLWLDPVWSVYRLTVA